MPARFYEARLYKTGPLMRVLAISSAYGGCAAAVLNDGHAVARGQIDEEMGLAAALPELVERLLVKAAGAPNLVAVAVGPGSFTGLRAGISVAAGVALGFGIPVVGVTVAEALAAGLEDIAQRTLWTAIEARRGRVFLEAGSGFAGYATNAIPAATGRVAVCGNAANLVAATLAARGNDVMLTDARRPGPAAVARVALRRLAGELPPLEAVPLYVDAPEAKLPAGGLRPAPV
jgi:tRNA threonylcarbamoyladenosine biosynthesis protein TsaB